MNAIKKFMSVAAIATSLFIVPVAVIGTSQTVYASTTGDACQAVGSSASCDPGASSGGLTIPNVVAFVIRILSFIVGIVAVIMVILGGFRYVTAGGDANKVSSAKSTLIYALIGLFIVGIAQVLVNIVVNKSLGF